MPKSRIIITIGVIVALLPILGFPHAWESFFQVVAGFSIVILSVWVTIDKRMTLRVKAQRRQIHKRRVAEIKAQEEAATLTPVEVVEQPSQEEQL